MTRAVYENPWIRVREDEVVRPGGAPGIYGVVDVRGDPFDGRGGREQVPAVGVQHPGDHGVGHGGKPGTNQCWCIPRAAI